MPFKLSCYTVVYILARSNIGLFEFFHTVCLRGLHESHNRQPLLPYTAFGSGFFFSIEAHHVLCEIRTASLDIR